MMPMNKPFIFTVAMLAEMLGNNPQYLSKKVRQMVEDPAVRLQATLQSNKKGYQIPEEEVLRCFANVSPEQIQQYKSTYLLRGSRPRVRKLTQPAPEAPQEETYMDLLNNWRIYLAGLSPEQKNTPETRAYLEAEAAKLQRLKEEKLKENAILERLILDCDSMISKIQNRLSSMPSPEPEGSASEDAG